MQRLPGPVKGTLVKLEFTTFDENIEIFYIFMHSYEWRAVLFTPRPSGTSCLVHLHSQVVRPARTTCVAVSRSDWLSQLAVPVHFQRSGTCSFHSAGLGHIS